jgi:hypothetical protein
LTRTLLPILFTLITEVPVMAVKIVSLSGRGPARGTLEYVFETDQPNVQATATKGKVAEIAADFMTTFYHIQIGALETQEFRTMPVPFWLVSFSEAIQGPAKQMYFVVVLPDGRVVEPSVSKRL